MDNRPIGVFDSGLGGLKAVKALRRLQPGEDIIYFGDTARVPYSGRSRETLLKYARQDIAFLRSFDLKAVLIACGTVTSTSLDTLRKENDLPVLGVVEPSCREALAVTKNKKIGMITTLASACFFVFFSRLQSKSFAITQASAAGSLFYFPALSPL